MDYTNLSSAQLRKGTIVKIVSCLALGSAVIFIRFAYDAGVTPGMAIFLRFFVAGWVLAVFLTLTRSWASVAPNRIAIILALGFFGYTIMGTTWFVALALTPVWLVSLIGALHPAAVNLGSWMFFRERIPPQQILALMVVLFGSVLLFWQPTFEDMGAWGGVILMFVNVIVVSAYILIGQRWMQGIPPMTSSTYTIWGAAGGTLLYALLIGELSFEFAPAGWFWIFCFAIISTALGIITLWWSIELIGASRSSIIGSIEILFSVLLAVLILGETMSVLQVIGGGLIMLGTFLVQWKPRRLAVRRAN